MPAFPFHGWMPDAYRAMPLPALAVFSGVVSKVAAYGFLRVTLPLFPDAVHDFQTILLVLALLSILYGSVMAFTQTNARLILGYSSVAQLGFITLGLFAADNAAAGAQGALMQAIQHGLVVAPMILVIVLLAERSAGSEDIRDMGGIAFRAPVLAGLFLVATLATLAMPGSANFVGEFLILLGIFNDADGLRVHRLDRRRARGRLRAAALHPRDAQPHRARGRRRSRSRCATRSCSSRSCWRSWPSGSSRRPRSTTPSASVKRAVAPVLQAGGAQRAETEVRP